MTSVREAFRDEMLVGCKRVAEFAEDFATCTLDEMFELLDGIKDEALDVLDEDYESEELAERQEADRTVELALKKLGKVA